MQIIRPVDVVAARIPGIEVDAAQVDRPQKPGKIVDHREIDQIG